MEASTCTGLLPPRPVHVTLAQWAEEWFAQKEALCRAGKKPRPSTLNSWRSDVKSLLTALGGYKLHDLTADVVIRYVDRYAREADGWRIADREIRFLWSERHDMVDAESMIAAARG